MEYKQNLHTHSTFCDGKDTPEEMVLTVMEKGFSSVGFSGHAYVPGSPFSKIFAKPLKALGDQMQISETSALGLLNSLITNTTTFEMVNRMDTKGIVLNSAFAVSGAFTFGAHLAFTLAYDADYLVPVIIGKLVAGFAALLLSIVIYKRTYKENR